MRGWPSYPHSPGCECGACSSVFMSRVLTAGVWFFGLLLLAMLGGMVAAFLTYPLS